MKEGAVPAAPHFKRDILTERTLRLEHVRIGPHIGKLGQFTLTHISDIQNGYPAVSIGSVAILDGTQLMVQACQDRTRFAVTNNV